MGRELGLAAAASFDPVDGHGDAAVKPAARLADMNG